MTNLYLRAKGFSFYRDGSDHGKYPDGAPALSRTEAESIPGYLNISFERNKGDIVIMKRNWEKQAVERRKAVSRGGHADPY